MLKVRVATVDDADTISSLNDEVQNVHAEALPHLFKPASRETFSSKKITEILTHPENHMFLAYFGEEPAGYLYCEIRNHLPRMYGIRITSTTCRSTARIRGGVSLPH